MSTKQNDYLRAQSLAGAAVDAFNTADRDDAIYIEDHGEYFFLRTLIANIIEPFSESIRRLDTLARKRVSSLYHLPEVRHMLPMEVVRSTSLGSRRDQEVFVVEFLFYKKTGELKIVQVATKIVSRIAKLHYDNVQEILDKPLESCEHGLPKMMHVAYDFAKHYMLLLRSRRQKVSYSELYKKTDLEKYSRRKIKRAGKKIPHVIVEAFMCLTNEMIARFCRLKKVPFPTRVFKKEINYIAREMFRQILVKKSERLNIDVDIEFHVRALSPMAYYGVGEHGHYELAVSEYNHSTSPIRRASDFFGQRNLHSWLTTGVCVYNWGELEVIVGHINYVEYSRRNHRRARKIFRLATLE
jgi:ribonuclease R